MNSCEYSEKLSAYHDDELEGEARLAVERHVAQCPRCAAELSRLRKLSALLGRCADAEVSATGMRRLHALADRSAGGDILRWAMTMTALAASVLIACSVLLWRQYGASHGAQALPEWEMNVIQRPSDSVASSSEDQFVTWMIQDLSEKNGYDKKN